MVSCGVKEVSEWTTRVKITAISRHLHGMLEELMTAWEELTLILMKP
jgi:hypothetical protein